MGRGRAGHGRWGGAGHMTHGAPRNGPGLTFCDLSSLLSISTCCSKATTFSWAVRLRASPSVKNGKVLLCRLGFCVGPEGTEDLGAGLGGSSNSFPAGEKHRRQDGQKMKYSVHLRVPHLVIRRRSFLQFPYGLERGDILCLFMNHH